MCLIINYAFNKNVKYFSFSQRSRIAIEMIGDLTTRRDLNFAKMTILRLRMVITTISINFKNYIKIKLFLTKNKIISVSAWVTTDR